MPRLLAALAFTILLGVLSRLCPVGWWPYDKSLGDVLYAVAAYLALALLFRRRSPALVAVVSLVWCLAVEFFELTDVPVHHAHLGVVRWLLGTTFSWHNLACYVIGV